MGFEEAVDAAGDLASLMQEAHSWAFNVCVRRGVI